MAVYNSIAECYFAEYEVRLFLSDPTSFNRALSASISFCFLSSSFWYFSTSSEQYASSSFCADGCSLCVRRCDAGIVSPYTNIPARITAKVII
jgi:hypothetical protein